MGDAPATRLVAESDLTPEDDDAIRRLLAEAFPDHRADYERRSWRGNQPDHRLLLADGVRLIGHVGIERRVIEVGSNELLVAGTGAIAIQNPRQRTGLGQHLMEELWRALIVELRLPFAVLTCRPSLAQFYAGAGWHRLDVTWRYRDPETGDWDISDRPIFVLAGTSAATDWPPGPIDLRGTPF